MSRNTGNRSGSTRKSGSPLLTGILVGMIIGVAMAAGLAWYIMKSPSPFVQNAQVVAKPPLAAVPQAPAARNAPVAASGVEEGKPRFEFYKVLTDKQEAAPAPVAVRPKAPPVKPVAEVQYLQAGSFSSLDDAERQKVRIALAGFEAAIQTVTIPDRGVWHRVRLGPYKNQEEMNNVRGTLKQNGVDATPIHAQ